MLHGGKVANSHLLPHLSSDVSKSLFPIEALGLETTVSEHFRYLGILWYTTVRTSTHHNLNEGKWHPGQDMPPGSIRR